MTSIFPGNATDFGFVTANERGGISRENNASIDYQSGAPTLNMTHLI